MSISVVPVVSTSDEAQDAFEALCQHIYILDKRGELQTVLPEPCGVGQVYYDQYLPRSTALHEMGMV
jgi:hypothetical protein